ncbi:glycosyltransferase family 2 protein [Agromyces seonyuensis]|uniref:Glycosyltransferase n=1 Tax=Agromyces seonyuensis TaxID=2662446 RepID=A0A6I4NY47_9MICO|nr:glycosyltransferase [Agromyces seonyuensis]MWB99236.1 glycosyltransferase [Agromyces seonyuensis]
MSASPLFSVVTPVYNTPPAVLRETVDSVLVQGWAGWELLLVDDRSPSAETAAALEEIEALDPRIRVLRRETNGGISAASNDGLAAARGEFVVLLDHDDLLVPGALAKAARAVLDDETIDYLYTDEDKIDEDGYTFDVFQKPDWSPERFRWQMYTCHMSVFRTELGREVGGFDSAFDGAQDHDLILKVTERARTIHHIPEVLYHWRTVPGSTATGADAKPYAWDAGVRAVSAHLERTGQRATAERGTLPGTYAVRRELDPALRVSVIIPTRGTAGDAFGKPRVFVVEAVRAVLDHTAHENLEFVVVYDETTPPAVLDELGDLAGDKLLLVPYAKPFNFSEKCNVGFARSTGDRIVLLNDDTEVISDGFIERLVAPLDDDGVGLTGALLYFEDGTVQHGGHRYGVAGYGHSYFGEHSESTGHFNELSIYREVTGVTAACSAITRELYAEIGGMWEGLPGNYNDVDYCYKVRQTGRRILFLHDVRLFHFESKTRVPTVHAWEMEFVERRWGRPTDDVYSGR